MVKMKIPLQRRGNSPGRRIFHVEIFCAQFALTTLFLLGGKGVTSVTSEDTVVCPARWLIEDNSCFFISDYLISRNEAQKFCTHFNSDLANVSSEKIEQLIFNNVPQENGNLDGVWIGFIEDQSSDEIEVEDNVDNVDNVEKCVVFNTVLQKKQVENCSRENGFVCSKAATSSEYGTTEVPFNCEEGMKSFSDSCYWTLPGVNNWEAADKWCQSESGHLVTISNSLENMFIYEFVRTQSTPHWIGLHVVIGALTWEAGGLVNYVNWDGQPSIGPGLCAVMERNGKWLMQPCSSDQIPDAVCEKKLSPNNGDMNFPNPNLCPSPWMNIGEDCVVLVKDPMTWQRARLHCTNMGGNLLVLKNYEEETRTLQLLVDQNLQTDYHVWLGLQINATSPIDSSWSNYTKTQYRELQKNSDSTTQCVTLNILMVNEWKTTACDKEYPFVCQINISSQNNDSKCVDGSGCSTTLSNVETTPSSSLRLDPILDFIDPCPDPWVGLDNKCYLIVGDALVTDRENWTAADAKCREFGSEFDLVSIHSLLEYQFLLEQLETRNLKRVWIGLNDKEVEGRFVWSDGSQIDFADWGWQEKLSSGSNSSSVGMTALRKGTADCVKIEAPLPDGKWYPISCNARLPYICQNITSAAPVPPMLLTTLAAGLVTNAETSTLPTTTKTTDEPTEVVTTQEITSPTMPSSITTTEDAKTTAGLKTTEEMSSTLKTTTTTTTPAATTTTTTTTLPTTVTTTNLPTVIVYSGFDVYSSNDTENPDSTKTLEESETESDNFVVANTLAANISTDSPNTELSNDVTEFPSEIAEKITKDVPPDEDNVSDGNVDNLSTVKCKCDSDPQMTSGTIAGIVLSCILGLGFLITVALYWHRRRFGPNYGSGKFSFDNALYNPHSDNIQLDTSMPLSS